MQYNGFRHSDKEIEFNFLKHAHAQKSGHVPRQREHVRKLEFERSQWQHAQDFSRYIYFRKLGILVLMLGRYDYMLIILVL